MLIAGTAGLFLLIKPAIQSRDSASQVIDVLPNSIAVLPFENASLGADDLYLSQGLSDELRDQLGRVEGLRIAARSSSIAARKRDSDAIEMSKKLRVATLVEGSMRKRGNQLRISVQLIDGASGLAIWSETFERGPNELLNVQQTIAEQVVLNVLPDSVLEASEPATRDVNANELMLLARYYDQQVRDRQEVDADTLREAVRLYRRAIEADPDSALAHSRLAGALMYLGDLEAAEAPIFRALSLNPNLSEVQNTLGEFYWARGLPEADTAFARAVELSRNNADALHNYAFSLWISYTTAPASIKNVAQLFRRALELDPLSLSRHAALGDFLGKDGQLKELHTVILGVQELFNDAESYRLIGWLKELAGEPDQAIAWTIRARNLEPDKPDHIWKLAELYATVGDFETTLSLEPEPGVGLLFLMRRYQDLIDIAEFLMIEEPGDTPLRFLLAFSYNATGQFESAIRILSTTGLPDSLLNGVTRSVAEIEGFTTLINALAGAGQEETVELARSLALWEENGPWWGDIAWVSTFRGCGLAILDRHEEALQYLQRVNDSPRLPRVPVLQDSFCFQAYADEPVYQEMLRRIEARQAELRERLPATLAEFGVKL
jgi:TolB-like protein/Tfp pilus assembly protein PilF